MPEAHERKVKRILARDWEQLREAWLDHVPNLSEPGQPPETTISDLPDLDNYLRKIPKDQVEEVFEDILGLRSGLLHEGIFLLHKAAHVMGSALVHVGQGMCTWSCSSAYQSALFAMRAALNMLGVSVIESPSYGHFLVDGWASPKKPRRGHRGPIIVLANTGRNEQRHLWAYLQRALDQTRNLDTTCAQEVRVVLLESNYTDFARQRNNIHYRTNVWGLDDLHRCVAQPRFGEDRSDPLEITQPDFSLRLAFGLVGMARRMLAQLAESSIPLQAELKLIDAWLAEPFNGLFEKSSLAGPPA
jgi:hypothetical protein